jgi:hypothetical protein
VSSTHAGARRRDLAAVTVCLDRSEPDFGVTSVNYDFAGLLARSEDPS